MLPKNQALDGVKLFVLDMDGTVYLGNNLIDGSLDFIRQVDADPDRDFIFFTNNASRVPEVYVDKLAKMGLTVTKDKIVTAGIEKLLARGGAPVTPKDIGLSRELFHASLIGGYKVRPRYSVMEFAAEHGRLEAIADKITAEYYD